MRFRGPLADSYPAAVALVIFALVPYLALTSAVTPLTAIIGRQVGLSPQALQLTDGMANAGYAFGTVMAIQLAVHLRGRRLLVLYATLFVIGSVLAVLAPTPGLFIAGRVLQGGCTSLMLIAAVPPLVTGWPVGKMPMTAVVMNLCVFGAVAIGPVVGGVQAGAGDWRPLFWVVAGLGGLALLFALLTFEDQEPVDPSAPWDWIAMMLAGWGCAAAFFGASELETHSLTSAICLIPIVAGAVAIALLVLHQYLMSEPLMPVRRLATTFPVAGIIVAMTAGAASVAAIELAQTALQKQGDPIHIAMLFWPEFGGAAVMALVLGAILRTRFIPLLAFAGMLLLAGGAAVLDGVGTGPHALVVVGSGLIGLGVGASVSPALFICGFSVQSKQLPRVFALIELLRGAAAFLVAPILLHLAMTVGRTPAAGGSIAIWVCFGLAVGGALVSVVLVALGGARLQVPALERWNEGEGPAWVSPPLAAGLRGEVTEPSAARRLTAPRRPPSRADQRVGGG
ncbi:MAG TPA: MFS transporter [Solirubrobacteraceae bacterium]|jgi:MFS family permease|nr:MFS transporter [Solirubrobacteraceae bacterium]